MKELPRIPSLGDLLSEPATRFTELLNTPLTIMASTLARSEGHRAGYREGAFYTATLLLDRACDVTSAEARTALQALAREIMAAMNAPPADTTEKAQAP